MARQTKPLLSLTETMERIGMSEVEKPASEETVVESMTEVFRKQNRVSVDDVVESMKSLARVRD